MPGTIQGRTDFMIKLADICPLVFNPIKDPFARDCGYTQRFHSSDRILIQVLSDSGEVPTATLNNKCDGSISKLHFGEYTINQSDILYYTFIENIREATYTVTLLDIESEEFTVSSDLFLLENTSLIRVSHYDNNSPFDNIWWIGNSQQFIEFRIEAGFKPSGIDEKVDDEFFRDQFQSITHLYSVPYETYILYIGNSSGVPYWVGKLINRMLSLSDFDIDGIKYTRSESSIPEKTQVAEDVQRFWFTQILELNTNDIAGIGGKPEQADPINLPSFALDGASDGDILRYSGDKSAFINTNIVD